MPTQCCNDRLKGKTTFMRKKEIRIQLINIAWRSWPSAKICNLPALLLDTKICSYDKIETDIYIDNYQKILFCELQQGFLAHGSPRASINVQIRK